MLCVLPLKQTAATLSSRLQGSLCVHLKKEASWSSREPAPHGEPAVFQREGGTGQASLVTRPRRRVPRSTRPLHAGARARRPWMVKDTVRIVERSVR